MGCMIPFFSTFTVEELRYAFNCGAGWDEAKEYFGNSGKIWNFIFDCSCQSSGNPVQSHYIKVEKYGISFSRISMRGPMSEKSHATKEEQYALSKVKYRKSNKLVNSRGRTSASVHKLFTVAISEAKLDASGNQAVAVIAGQKLRKIFNNYTGSFYETVKNSCNSPTHKPDLLSWRLGMEDEENKTFKYINVVNSAEFSNGELRIVFSPEVTKEISGLKSNYSEFYRYITLRMKSSYSMVLYERLSGQADYLRSTTRNLNGPYYISYSIEELRSTFSLDYETVENRKKVQKHMYARYIDMKKNVLDVAREEINEISPIHVDYKPILAGHGGKTVSIEFIVTRKDEAPAEEISKEEETRRKIVYADVTELLSEEDIGVKDIRTICSEAGYCYEKIEAAYQLAKKQDYISNFTGWMISAIKNEYKESSSSSSSDRKGKATGKTSERTSKEKNIKERTSKSKKDFQKFEPSEYDMDQLEKDLLAN